MPTESMSSGDGTERGCLTHKLGSLTHKRGSADTYLQIQGSKNRPPLERGLSSPRKTKKAKSKAPNAKTPLILRLPAPNSITFPFR